MITKIKFYFTSFLILFCAANIQAAPKVVDGVAAIVNNNVILQSDIDEMLQNVKASTDPQNLPDDKALRHQIIERLINENLILQQAAKLNIKISEDDITEAIKSIAQKNNMTINDLRGYLASVGMSYNSYRHKISKELLIEQARMNIIKQRIMISDREVNNLANEIAKQPNKNREVNISHILIALPESPSKKQIEDANTKAQNIVDRLKKGESFAKLAATYSNDEKALEGGKMGWHKLNELPSIFEERLVRAQKNDIIGPIRSGVGFHILKVEGNHSEAPKIITIKEVNARHILIKTNVLVTDEIAKNKIQEIRQSIVNGSTSFASAAKLYSEDPGSADNGGELGWNNPNNFDSNFRAALLRLSKGEISQPVKSSYGWHLIQLMDSRNVDKTEDAKKDQAYRLIFNRKFGEELQVWIQELKGDAYIKIMGDDN
ncbi:peptidylprolyl isomerase SurA [Frischella sp. Ac48]|uniref:Chaperone SurA n=1 Tax=Frischella japonica TaxID=2741544 RepID=A0ABR7QXX5_9GAMM|nr:MULTISPECIES: peptidylprolyl isomerase SurA [Frischella]MBC9131074.1 peptidylprolyl isomerase SurA [Frischella japonica]MBX4132046.1 peptidylprolyl isomerase SurA [Frischella sp. Ac48]